MRIGQIITLDLAKDKLILEERLENMLNSDIDIRKKMKELKRILKDIAMVDNMYNTWGQYVASTENLEINNKEENK